MHPPDPEFEQLVMHGRRRKGKRKSPSFFLSKNTLDREEKKRKERPFMWSLFWHWGALCGGKGLSVFLPTLLPRIYCLVNINDQTPSRQRKQFCMGHVCCSDLDGGGLG